MYALVALPLAVTPLTYSIPNDLQSRVQIGSAVRVPLRKTIVLGVVLSITNNHPATFSAKPIIDLLPGDLSLPESIVKLIQWISDYYHYPIGQVLQQALPPIEAIGKSTQYVLTRPFNTIAEESLSEFKKRGGKKYSLIELINENGFLKKIPPEFKTAAQQLIRLGFIEKQYFIPPPKPLAYELGFSSPSTISLNDEQAVAVDKILNSKSNKPFLLHGITGSGKTEVYLAIAKHILRAGGGVLFLVPEIALTPQLFSRVRAQLGDNVALLHSALSDKERMNQWRLLSTQQAHAALGARSAIFAPIHNLKLIIVDEEHESAFKQEDRLRYNARDIAIVRSKIEAGTVILGSATPSLESLYNTRQSKYEIINLQNRHNSRELPRVEIVDLTKDDMGDRLIGHKLEKEIRLHLEKKQQVLLFLNRRGSAGFKLCLDCGHVFRCQNCSVSLTAYSSAKKLLCHYCGYREPLPTKCGQCSSTNLRDGSPGTEHLEQEAKNFFPQARIQRIDRHEVRDRISLESILSKMQRSEIDILIGTQMVAKGHDFPGLALVGVIDADLSLNIPDFRSAEKTYQLITQVAGRAGRGNTSGKVIIQTRSPEQPALLAAAQPQKFNDFASAELETRFAFHYPPFFRLARILVTSTHNEIAENFAQRILSDLQKNADHTLELLGPAPAVLQKIQNQFRWNILIKAKDVAILQRSLKTFAPRWRELLPKHTLLQIDVDPLTLL